MRDALNAKDLHAVVHKSSNIFIVCILRSFVVSTLPDPQTFARSANASTVSRSDIRTSQCTGAHMKILVGEDDPIQAEAVSTALSSLSHAVTIVDDGERAVRCLRSEPIDAVFLDWHLPRMSGIEVLHWIRSLTNVRYVVLFLNSRMHEVDVVRALDAGAVDYMVKPFRAEELAARVNALLRRVARTAARDEQIRAGDYVLDPIERTVTLRGGRIDMTTKEIQLVAALFN